MSATTTARHATPAPPPPERDPFIRGPFALELVLTLAATLFPLGAVGVVLYRWVYVVETAPAVVYAALAGAGVALLVGFSVLGWLIGVHAAAKIATAVTAAELGARRLGGALAAAARRPRTDRGSSTALFVVTVGIALVVIAAVVGLLLALFGQLDEALPDDQGAGCLVACDTAAGAGAHLVYTGTGNPAVLVNR